MYEVTSLVRVLYATTPTSFMVPAHARCKTLKQAERWVRRFGVRCEVVRWKSKYEGNERLYMRCDGIWYYTPQYLKDVVHIDTLQNWPVETPFILGQRGVVHANPT